MLALCSLGVPEAYEVIDRPALQAFLLHMHQDDGSYIMHQDGEKDIRWCVCACICGGASGVLARTGFTWFQFHLSLFCVLGQ